MPRALIPGTYDPITLGHIDIIKRSTRIFDDVIVGVAASPLKGNGPLFSLEERVAFVEDAVSDLPTVRVIPFNALLVDFATKMGVHTIVKGLRVVTDFEYEFQQASLNNELNSSLETMFIMSNLKYMYLSSSIVKEVASLGGETSAWLPKLVQKEICRKFRQQS